MKFNEYPCPNCKSPRIQEHMIKDAINYGCPTEVMLFVTQPVMFCEDCGESWTDWRGEEIREAAVVWYQRRSNEV
jgi:hypothetical protein